MSHQWPPAGSVWLRRPWPGLVRTERSLCTLLQFSPGRQPVKHHVQRNPARYHDQHNDCLQHIDELRRYGSNEFHAYGTLLQRTEEQPVEEGSRDAIVGYDCNHDTIPGIVGAPVSYTHLR